MCKTRYGPFADQLIKPIRSAPELRSKTARDLMRDAAFGWQTWTWARLQATTGKSKGLLLLLRSAPRLSGRLAASRYGIAAWRDVPYVFQTLNPTEAGRHCGRPGDLGAVATYWTNFAKLGDPNGAGRARVAALQRRRIRRVDVLQDQAHTRTGSQRRRAQGPGSVFCLAADAGGRSFCEIGSASMVMEEQK